MGNYTFSNCKAYWMQSRITVDIWATIFILEDIKNRKIGPSNINQLHYTCNCFHSFNIQNKCKWGICCKSSVINHFFLENQWVPWIIPIIINVISNIWSFPRRHFIYWSRGTNWWNHEMRKFLSKSMQSFNWKTESKPRLISWKISHVKVLGLWICKYEFI